ncbi:hypothetical protein Taro_015606 [Colocasia esculenta]|uniref:Uncharacterized protein n=1 Tax=Colocasia esculenta TaxID=4460 RepID=A0A843UTN6_COLES|nr:hypothetical protein [Colocasia esculenta]
MNGATNRKSANYPSILEAPHPDPDDMLDPFLRRFPISTFGICLGLCSQAGLWQALATSRSTRFLHVPLCINFIVWCFALALTALMFVVYSLKIIFHFDAVRREFRDGVRVNFFFAPWIACLLLFISLPPSIEMNLHEALWYVLMAPILGLGIKVYGQWMSRGRRRLSKLANPLNHLAIVGNFVGAMLGASMGLREGPIFFFAVGLAHYVVVFVTLYQRLETNEALPRELNPGFFLFLTPPSVASLAWEKIDGHFGYGSKIAFFVAAFLYVCLAVRINFFRGFRFSLAWWSYTYPMTAAASASIRYSMAVTNPVTRALSVVACAISVTISALLLVNTAYKIAFMPRKLFPNDCVIAISKKRKTTLSRGNPDDRGGGSVAIDIRGL